ncbi:CoB--CoM heterodisulfide reductase, subunit A [Dissulfuribacter thermophilus]|uniref:CoB--CoM heterodisulfide reductase, subunit A n=1 Tax=Dissulfuribacter thermophilus TaxID=1156395 RepID=A0A1B9F3I9_9BACT|nr:CoB--CoM heterodisulfide reductase iron-sulfur subunit A family protein [Dissulfuribacter thermophilus]OCC14496.1 CoB--CoM heterodisulfide reductase, subunit A [Dissulfuribacter thermophilus]
MKCNNSSNTPVTGSVLVIGGGVAGVQASLDLTELGYKVYLLEKTASIGGAMARLDKTFPTNDCSLCILAPKLVEAGRNPNIEIITNAELISLNGKPGSFTAKVLVKPRFIDETACTGCGQCSLYCPRIIADQYNERLELARCAHIDYPQAVPTSYYIDAKACLRVNYDSCGLCASLCQKKAIDFDQSEGIRELNVGAAIVAPGFGRIKEEFLEKFGWGLYEDVLTAFEFERLMCASGPTNGEIVRISDGRHPKRIAFLQCIGSRDERCGNNYCSSVCCMYAIKEATMAKEHDPDVQITLFYMDVRTHGKGFDAARERAIREHDLRIVYARPARVEQIDGQLLLTYVAENGRNFHEFYDMVVLTNGLEAVEDAEKLSESTGISLNSYNFAYTGIWSPLSSDREGVFVAGAFQGPKDIPDSVTQASGAASLCAGLLKEARDTETLSITYPEERDVSNEEPRIGVFVCSCGINIGGVVDVKKVQEYARTLPGVVYATDNLYTCSQDTQRHITEIIREYNLNRVVVAACTPRTHEPLFQATLRAAGLNRSLFEMANIRDQCSWVHMNEPQAATEKAKDLVRMAVAKAQHLAPLPEQELPVVKSALVIGGGVAGLTAALTIAEQGYYCTLVEREHRLGGRALALTADRLGNDPRQEVSMLIEKVKSHPKIRVCTGAVLSSVSGYVGDFRSTISIGSKTEEISHGVIVLATGGRPYIPKGKFFYGESSRVITQIELEERLASRRPLLPGTKHIVMIQCVGSRGNDLSYCSRVCCGQALKNALRIKKLAPDIQVVILYRDMRAYGFIEDDYREARRKGVIFQRYSLENPPRASLQKDEKSPLAVLVWDSLLNREIEWKADLLVLSTGIVPEDVQDISKILKVPTTEDGFFLEAHVKLRPVDLAVDGVYVCGLAHSPRSIDESIAQAQAAAARACLPLARGKVEPEPIVSMVDKEKCIGCGACEQFCPYNAIRIYKEGKRRKASTLAASCKGCGICAARCPVLAIEMGRFTYHGIMAQIHAFSGKEIENE